MLTPLGHAGEDSGLSCAVILTASRFAAEAGAEIALAAEVHTLGEGSLGWQVSGGEITGVSGQDMTWRLPLEAGEAAAAATLHGDCSARGVLSVRVLPAPAPASPAPGCAGEVLLGALLAGGMLRRRRR